MADFTYTYSNTDALTRIDAWAQAEFAHLVPEGETELTPAQAKNAIEAWSKLQVSRRVLRFERRQAEAAITDLEE